MARTIVIVACFVATVVLVILARYYTRKSREAVQKAEEDVRRAQVNADPKRFLCLVEIKHPGVLADNEQIAKLLHGKLKGKVFFSAVFAQNTTGTCSTAEHVRPLWLEDESDFDRFSEFMMTIPGVTGVKRQGDDWTRSADELLAYQADCKGAEAFREKQSQESFAQRQQKLSELKAIERQMGKYDEAHFGPASKPIPLRFEGLLSGFRRCQVEIRGTFSDILAGGFLGYEQVVKVFSSTEGITDFIEETVNGPMRLPFAKDFRFSDIPWAVETREKNGWKFAHLMVGGGHPHYIMAAIEIFIREISDHMVLIPLEPHTCPREGCGSTTSSSGNGSYRCSACGKEFCICCAKKDYEGTGDYIFCPECGEKLYFPAELQKHP